MSKIHKQISLSSVVERVSALIFGMKYQCGVGSNLGSVSEGKLIKPRPLDCVCTCKCDPYYMCITWVSIQKKKKKSIDFPLHRVRRQQAPSSSWYDHRRELNTYYSGCEKSKFSIIFEYRLFGMAESKTSNMDYQKNFQYGLSN